MSNFKKLLYTLLFILIIEIILIFIYHNKQQKIEINIIKRNSISLSNNFKSSFYKKFGEELIK
ncbi:hypothetical protein NRP93_002858 [Clostridium botulinum]|nr:hypothetical protein [Clostridium botulinum]